MNFFVTEDFGGFDETGVGKGGTIYASQVALVSDGDSQIINGHRLLVHIIDSNVMFFA